MWSVSLVWTIEVSDTAKKQLAKLDRVEAKRITRFLSERLVQHLDPRQLGDALTGPLKGAWRYRVGDYRIICRMEDQQLIVLVLGVGHRSDVYRQ
jgi:mRNA interferase RelE/StbE